MNLSNFFKNPFAIAKVGDDKVKLFTKDHLSRLRRSTDAVLLKPILDETQILYDAYFGGINSEARQSAERKAHTFTTDSVMAAFKARVSQQEGLIRSKYNVKSAKYLQFFPQNRTEYARATKANIETLMNRFADVAESCKADLGEDFVAEFRGYCTDYETARTQQLDTKSGVRDTKKETFITREKLETQLVRNLHFIGYHFPGDVDKGVSFFDQSLLSRTVDSDKDGWGQVEGEITNEQGEPLLNATVAFINRKVSPCYTDNDGAYLSRYVEVGPVKLSVSREGYESQELEIEVKDIGTTLLNITLLKTK
jgi:hypothetical protein